MATPLELSRLFLDGWEASSPEAISRLFAADGMFANPLQPKPLIGPKQILEALIIGLGKLQDVRIHVTGSFEHETSAVVEGKFISQRRGDGSRFDFPFVLILEARNGKIHRLAEYFDTAPLR